MAVPSYTTDLTVIADADTITGWGEAIAPYALGAGPALDGENRIQGIDCVSQATGNKAGVGFSIIYDAGAPVTFAAGECVFMWSVFAVGSNLYTYANDGHRLIVGSNNVTLAAESWTISGSDFRPNPYGGWYNYVVDPSSTPDVVDGGGNGGVYQFFGSVVSLLVKIAKGSPHAVDVIRKGRGELIIEFGQAADYGTFAGIATNNDYDDAVNGYNRWGLFQATAGGYLWKGLMSFGNATNACDFRDANRSITIDDTPKVYADFNRIEVNNTASRVDWTSINISAGGTFARGNFEAIDNATINFSGCTFTDMGTFIFNGGVNANTILASTFRRCALITQGGATITNSLITNSTATSAMSVDDLSLVTDNTFESAGTGYAVDLGVIGSTQSLDWKNTDTGYAASDGTTGNETIVVSVATGITLTLNIIAGYTTPTVHNIGTGGAASIAKVIAPVTLTATIQTGSGTKIQNARVLVQTTETVASGLPYDDTVTISNSGTTATVTHTAHGMLTGDKVVVRGASLPANNGVYIITKLTNDTYSYTMASTPGASPTGTIKVSFVFLSGLSDINGQISVTRSLGADQACGGWARKSTGSPLYKTGPISGTASSSTNTSLSAIMTPDE